MSSKSSQKSEKSDLYKIWQSFCAPFKVMPYHKHDLCLWFIYVLFASLLGVVINVVKRCVFDGQNFQEALTYDSQAGSFYTFSLVICASLIWPIFKSITSKEKPEYSLIRTIVLTILIFTDLFCAIFYAFSSIHPHKCYLQICPDWHPLDILQLLFSLIAVALSFYSFGLTYLHEHTAEFRVTDDHLRNENKEVEKIKNDIEIKNVAGSRLVSPETQNPVRL